MATSLSTRDRAAAADDGAFRPGLRVTLLLGGGVERRGLLCWSREGRAALRPCEPVPALFAAIRPESA
ncbi:hypothetical protein GCM10023232_28110 [Sphingosinicella ginsenosidimutans]|uniref:Uncharacterized protein n=1 Tax=Allosphingosinicella ginsenosidimutans TaxID=1176539 RepID=A0A5C6TSH8_9SPHN|nr:hypothetical protein [Sphingosinicella ginsenosidimutans]TXC63169.1 hypothetical protein FRZ32_05540 [Sphingosinicella ginsenosidimutans]